MSLRVQFGSGSNQLPGWENTEYPAVDITKPLPYTDNSVDEALAEHVAEHISGPNFLRFICEVRRILKPGGVFHLSCPVLDSCEPEHARDLVVNHGHEIFMTRDSMNTVCSLAGFKDIRLDLENGVRPAIYNHWRVIGSEKDDLESHRLLLTK